MVSSSDFTGFDYAAGVATGQRSFEVTADGKLTGVHQQAPWGPGENVASCITVMGGEGHRPPAVGCGCGFWAYHDGSSYPAGPVSGVIEGYGRVTIGPRGFRAEKARIVALTTGALARRDRFPAWTARNWGLSAFLGFVLFWAGLQSAVWSYVVANKVSGYLGWPLLALGVVSIAAGVRVFRARRRGQALFYSSWFDPYRRLRRRTVRLLKENYPDVEFYPTREAMLKAHPVDPQILDSATPRKSTPATTPRPLIRNSPRIGNLHVLQDGRWVPVTGVLRATPQPPPGTKP